MLCERVSNFFKKLSSISSHPRICTFKHFKCARISVARQFVISVYPLILLHHQYFRVHLRLFKSFASHLSLKVCRSSRIYPLYMIKCGLNLLLLELPLILHKVLSLIMQKQVSLIDHIKFLLC